MVSPDHHGKEQIRKSIENLNFTAKQVHSRNNVVKTQKCSSLISIKEGVTVSGIKAKQTGNTVWNMANFVLQKIDKLV